MSLLKNLLKVGYVVKPHGRFGGLYIRFLQGCTLSIGEKIYLEHTANLQYVQHTANLYGPFNITSISRRHREGYILKLPGLNTLSEAEKFRGYSIGVDRKKLPENTYWVEEIIGCEIYSSNRKLIGRVEEVLHTGANDVYVVKSPAGREQLIPALKSIVVKVNVHKKEIIIKEIPGLFDEN